jgi:hypothetical protein
LIRLQPRIAAIAARQIGAAEDLRRPDDLAAEDGLRKRQKLAARYQRCAPALDAFRKAGIQRALLVAQFLGPVAAGDLEEITRLAPVLDDPVKMRADQTVDSCLLKPGSSATRIAA